MSQESGIVHLHGREFRKLQRCGLLFLLHGHPRFGEKRKAGWLVNLPKLKREIEECLKHCCGKTPLPILYNLRPDHVEELLDEWDNLFRFTIPFEPSWRGIVDSVDAMEKAVCHPSLEDELKKYVE